MRMSCNGCRVLRKGCSDNCSIRPCLQWIKNPESQANATVFLAKFYGRAGLMNLINAGPEHLRPAIFRSLLYEACGRIVNPIYGSVGLLWSGSWQLCQAAVEAVLKGAPITQIPTETAANTPTPPLKAYDIRHVLRPGQDGPGTGCGDLLHKVNKSSRTRFKRSGAGACAATEDSNNNNSGARNSTSPDSHRASPPALLRLGGAGGGGVSASAACGTGMGLEEEGEYDHDDHHADAAERVAGGVGFDGFDHESSDSQHDDESADERGFHELRLMDTAGVGGSATETVVGPRHGSGESVCGSAENHHHDSPDASMVTSHNHGGLTSEEDEDHDRDSGHHQDGGDADEDDGEVELELTLGGPKRRRS